MNNELKNWCDRNASDMDAAEYDAEVRRRVCSRRLKAVGDFAGGVALIVLVVWLVRAFCQLTPDQMSGEYDWAAEEAKEVR